jgi:multidrug efflux pump subunit AcrA (membrane-fusion protein)
MRTTHAGVLTVVALAAIAIVGGCGQNNSYVAPPPPKVTVASPIQQPITRYLELTGSAAAVNTANLVARVPGFVHEINYQDGAIVKKDTLLFTIEPEPYEVKLKQAQAAEAGAQASLKQAQTEFDRQAKLVTTRTATQAAYDQAALGSPSSNRRVPTRSTWQARCDTRWRRCGATSRRA